MQELFNAIREECSPAIWSRGVQLSRAGAVVGESDNGAEVELRVRTQDGLVSPLVVLYIDDEDWSCDCVTREPVCVHVAAAVIALRQARQAGTRLPGSEGVVGKVAYRFLREGHGLVLERCLGFAGHSERLDGTLSAAGSNASRPFAASQLDIEIERLLGPNLGRRLTRSQMGHLLKLLLDHPDVQLDGKPVRVGQSVPGIAAAVVERGENYLVVLEQNPALEEIFPNGAVRTAEDLCPLEDPELSQRELERYRKGELFGHERVSELVTKVLPGLHKRLPVDVRTKKLPTLRRGLQPRVVLEVGKNRGALTVLATLVYGSPVVARVFGDKLAPVGDVLPQRDEEEEGILSRRLGRTLDLVPGVRQAYIGEAAVNMARKLRRWEGELKGSGVLDDFFVAPRLKGRVNVTDADLEILFETTTGDATSGDSSSGKPHCHSASPEAVLQAWRLGESLVPLSAGGFAPLPHDWLKKYGAQIQDLLAAKEAREKLPRSALFDLGKLCDALDLDEPPGLANLRQLLGSLDHLPEPSLPADLTATLRTYQRTGVAWLQFVREAGLGAVLADDMGLGKTLQVLCALRGKTLVVAPASVVHNWLGEMKRFRPKLRSYLYHGAGRSLSSDADVVVTTYALLRLDLRELSGVAWDTVVLDESQNIKNPASQVARAAYRLPGEFRVTLSGTPVENRLEELWSQLRFTNPGLLGSREDFVQRYVKPVADGDPIVLTRLKQRIGPFLMRRRKREVAPELPPRTEGVLRCELVASERQTYEAIHAATRQEVLSKLQAGGSVLAALEALLRLRQACCHVGLIPGQQAETSSKVTLLLETLDKVVAEGHRALVFSQWTSLLDRVEPHLQKAGIAFVRLDGATRDRAKVVEAFQSSDAEGPPVMLVSLKAGGTGLNLTAADHVFLLDPWWNPAVEDQAADRAHRIGQDRPVFVYRLVATDTVEERILELQEHKREIAEAALGHGDAARALTREDLLGLLS